MDGPTADDAVPLAEQDVVRASRWLMSVGFRRSNSVEPLHHSPNLPWVDKAVQLLQGQDWNRLVASHREHLEAGIPVFLSSDRKIVALVDENDPSGLVHLVSQGENGSLVITRVARAEGDARLLFLLGGGPPLLPRLTINLPELGYFEEDCVRLEAAHDVHRQRLERLAPRVDAQALDGADELARAYLRRKREIDEVWEFTTRLMGDVSASVVLGCVFLCGLPGADNPLLSVGAVVGAGVTGWLLERATTKAGLAVSLLPVGIAGMLASASSRALVLGACVMGYGTVRHHLGDRIGRALPRATATILAWKIGHQSDPGK